LPKRYTMAIALRYRRIMSRSPPGKERGNTILFPTSEALVSPLETTSTRPYMK